MKSPREYEFPEGAAVEAVFGKASGYRVKLDEAYYAEKEADKLRREKLAPIEKPYLRVVECRRGRRVSGVRANLFIHGPDAVGFVGVGLPLREELLAIPGVAHRQCGDREFSVVFPASLTPRVAEVVKPFARRKAVCETPKPVPAP